MLKDIARSRPAFMRRADAAQRGPGPPKVRAGKVDFRSIKLCFSGAAPLMAETQRRFEELTGGASSRDIP